LLGLAFRLYDPDGLLGGKKDLGITCALVPHDHPGVDTGRRHFPLNAMFMNGPTRGDDVFMPLDFIIGGPAMAGQGWRMLMECLAAGRSISLPSSNTGMSKLTARAVGGYARVRSQFRMPVGKFEGVEEALARIGGNTYMMDAARSMTAGAVDLGEKPSVVSAIVKYHVTERARQVVNDGMDVIGGKGICLGPNNFLGRAYQQIPIGITVEGANILTRSLIIFGQGAIRCHPYVLAEMRAAQSPDRKQGLTDFDTAFWGHVGFVVRNKLRALGTALTGARFVTVNADVAPGMKRYYQLLSRYSAAFALLADTSMLVLGGSLKRRERLSARLGDVLSQMYLVSATLKRYEDEGRQAADAPLAHWSIQDALYKLQEAINGVLENYPNRFVAWGLARIIFPWGRTQMLPSDQLGQDVARLLIHPCDTRDRLTAGCHLPATEDEPVGAIEQALAATLDAEPIEAKIRELEKRGALEGNPQANVRDIADAAFAMGGITAEEYTVVKRRNRLRDAVVKVDDFPFDLGASDAIKPAAERKVA
jgi:acyl-CoA dehydrogenase